MKSKWKYVVTQITPAKAKEQLDQAGEEGWELVSRGSTLTHVTNVGLPQNAEGRTVRAESFGSSLSFSQLCQLSHYRRRVALCSFTGCFSTYWPWFP